MAANEKKFRMKPDICTYASDDEGTLNLELSIPGAKKEQINLKMMDTSFRLSAPGKDVEYVSATAFCCPVNASQATATFEDGCLKIKVPFKDPKTHSFQVPVR